MQPVAQLQPGLQPCTSIVHLLWRPTAAVQRRLHRRTMLCSKLYLQKKSATMSQAHAQTTLYAMLLQMQYWRNRQDFPKTTRWPAIVC